VICCTSRKRQLKLYPFPET